MFAPSRIDEAHARYSAARAELLGLVTELAASEEWFRDGATDPASWLCARLQISLRSARELMRDAEALVDRPVLVAALAAGSASVDQCRALAVLGDRDADDRALENLPYWSLSELEREVRKETARTLERRDDGVYLRMSSTRDERYVRGVFQLHPEDGAALIAAIDARLPAGTSLRDLDRASATALVDLAKGSVVAKANRPIVVIDGDVAELGSGGVVGAETARRMSCDATVNGKAIPSSTRRAVEARDGHRCTFPGCGKDVYLQCHHIVHRSDGGSNDMSNLQLVCWKHHELIHEGGWSIRGSAGQRCTWVRPDGTVFEPRVALDTS